jgi:hypothetical protein
MFKVETLHKERIIKASAGQTTCQSIMTLIVPEHLYLTTTCDGHYLLTTHTSSTIPKSSSSKPKQMSEWGRWVEMLSCLFPGCARAMSITSPFSDLHHYLSLFGILGQVLGPAIPNTVTTVTWEKIQVQSSKYSFY